jgi:hypothetical protein
MQETTVQVGRVTFITTDRLTFDGMALRTRRLLAAIAIGWTLGEPMSSVEVVSSQGRVAIVSIEPIRQPDPILPVILADVGGDWRGHLLNWYHHQLAWEHSRRHRDFRIEWFEKGRAILSRLLAHIRPYLTSGEMQYLTLELAAVLTMPDEPR